MKQTKNRASVLLLGLAFFLGLSGCLSMSNALQDSNGTFDVTHMVFDPTGNTDSQYPGGIYNFVVALKYDGTKEFRYITGSFDADQSVFAFEYPEDDTKAYIGFVKPNSGDRGLAARSWAGNFREDERDRQQDIDRKIYPVIKLKQVLTEDTTFYLDLEDRDTGTRWRVPITVLAQN